MSLFQTGNFTLASGEKSSWKIECDALTDTDWETLALIASKILSPFNEVEGVPTGGLAFAKALEKYTSSAGGLLIAEDVVTTGGSMEKFRAGREAQGIAVFGRGGSHRWVKVLFQQAPGQATINEFREKYCLDCYWGKWHGCDIEIVTVSHCANSTVERGGE